MVNVEIQDAYYCLLIAVFRNISVEKSFQMFYTGKKEFRKRIMGNRNIKNEMTRYHQAGLSINQLGQRYGMSKTSVCRYLRTDKDKNDGQYKQLQITDYLEVMQ